MPIVIDGWNFIRNNRSDIDDIDGDAMESAASLMGYLNDFQRSHNDPIVVVFDSKSGHLELAYQNTPRLKAVAAINADAYIKRYIDKMPERQRRNLRVISSDNAVYYYAKSAYASPLKSEEFWEKIKMGRAGVRK